jgi:hypothetical protein
MRYNAFFAPLGNGRVLRSSGGLRMNVLKVTTVGNSVGVILPKEILERLRVGKVVEKKNLPDVFLDRLIRLAAFQNPEFYKNQAMRLSTFGKARVIGCAEDFGYLRRDPDASGFNFWLNSFNGNFVEAEMVKAFISSNEYRERFRAN